MIITFRGGKDYTSFIQNVCDKCGWEGKRHYAYHSCQHSNYREERAKHQCNKTDLPE